MFTKRQLVLLGVAGLVASVLLVSLTTGVFAQGTATPTPTTVRQMMPMGTPGAHMRDTGAVTSTMPMSGTRQEMHRTEMTSTMPMTSTGSMCDMMSSMMSGMMGNMGAITSTMPMTATGSMCEMMKGMMSGGMMGGQGMMPGGMMGGRQGMTGQGMIGGRGMMGGTMPGGMMGTMGGQGMMPGMGYDDGEPGVAPEGTAKRLDGVQVEKAVSDYLAVNYNNPDLEILELMEFEKNFYAQVAEKSTKINAFELLIDPYTGAVMPEYGPNMMWNTKYGHLDGMGGMMQQGWAGPDFGQPTAEMPVKLDQARKNAQAYLDARKSGLTIEEDTDVFYGYYTVHTLDKEGNTVGMLSVNGYTGRVWYHTWHGKFVGMADGM